MRCVATVMVAGSILGSGCSLVDALSGGSLFGKDEKVCTEQACWSITEIEADGVGELRHIVIAPVVGDDSIPDIVYVRDGASPIMLLGYGDGSFDNAVPVPDTGSQAYADVVAMDPTRFPEGTQSLLAFSDAEKVLVRMEDGTSFTVPFDDTPGPLAIGNFDDDALPDVAVGLNTGEIAILLQANDFQPMTPRLKHSTHDGPVFSLTIGRFNRLGGCHDLVGLQNVNEEAILAYYICNPDGAGMFEEQREFGDVASPHQIVAGTFEPGQLDDVALGTTCSACDGYDAIRLQSGQGQFRGAFVHGSATQGPFELSEMVVGNFDSRGGGDVVLVGAGRGQGPTVIFAFDADLSNGSFPDVAEISGGPDAVAIASGDLNEDAFADFAILNRDDNIMLLLSDN